MRCGVEVDKKPTIAVVLNDVPFLTHSESEIKRALEGDWGSVCQKDFLRPGYKAGRIVREVNDRKRRCFAFYKEKLPTPIVEELMKGMSDAATVLIKASSLFT